MRRTRLIPLLVAGLSGLAARASSAQWQVAADLGTSQLRQTGLGQSNATTVGLSAETGSERFAVRSAALGAFMGADRATGQWLTTAIVATPARNAWSLQSVASVSAFGQSNLAPTSSADGVLELRVGDGKKSVAFGGGGGVTSHNGVAIPNMRGVADASIAFDREQWSIDASVTRTRAVFGESSILVDNSVLDASYVDVGGGWRHTANAWQLGASAGIRARPGSGRDEWHALDGEVWVAPRWSLVASVGRTLADLVRGVPRATYATLALRLSSRPHSHVLAGGPRGPRLVVSPAANQMRRLELLGVQATSVELMADFTDWLPVPLERVGTSWRTDRLISSGPHRVAIRIDGGQWIAPPNLPRVADDLGGVVGLITIP